MSAPVTTRNHPSYWAFVVHRVSGLALACFLPVHLYVIGLAIEGEAKLDSFLHWSQLPLVKLAETGLVFLLAVHLFGGLRLLALENMPWSNMQKNYAAVAVASAFFVALGFLLRAF